MKMKYPRIGAIRSQRPKHNCKLCGKAKSDKQILIQVNRYRGDDDVYYVHDGCIVMNTLLKELIK